MLTIALPLLAIVALAVLYRFLPNRKLFLYFCLSLVMMFFAGAFVGLQLQSEPSIDEEQRSERLQQEKFFIEWYGQYQKDIEQLDRNWQSYHSIVDGYKENRSNLDNTYERLRELEREVLIEQVHIHTLRVPAEVGSECGELLSEVVRKTQSYVDAQTKTISLSKNAANPEFITFEDRNEINRRLQDIMIRESPVGLFTANEISAIRDYFSINN